MANKEATMGFGTILSAMGIPASWHFFLVSLAAMILLAGLDFIGAIFAKAWTENRELPVFLAGLAAFVVLYVVYAHSLRIAELSVVTFGWVVFLQVCLLVYERLRYDVSLPPGKWVAISLILALQAYLILAPNAGTAGR